MKRITILAGLFICFASLVSLTDSTCVLESDFGFTINCAFKKSGLFRVRNLGGIKAHVGLGFSVGDELGFGQSLTNLDPSRRRSVSVNSGIPSNAIGETVPSAAKQEKRGKQNRLIMRQPSQNHPPQMPTTAGAANLVAVKAAMANLQRRVQTQATTMQPIVVPSAPAMDQPMRLDPIPKITIAKPLPMSVPPFRPLPPKDTPQLNVVPIASTWRAPQLPQAKGPGLAYTNPDPHGVNDLASQIYPVYSSPTKKIDDYNSIGDFGEDSLYKHTKDDINAKISQIAQAGNISMEAVEAAILLRQQQLLNQYANIPMPASTTTSTTTTTEPPLSFQPQPTYQPVTQKQKRYPIASGSAKVMNAPREYYPIGYEKNYDDKFESKVELPETNFYCGDQKYFPGLYADENLGCMVFHVCALTDDGLVMKSFLCPESTLFDQTILKCNWWFYVDCKASKQLYDTNIPVSKSYQLMKALTFFSNYKKESADEADHTKNPEDIEGIKEAIAILGNHDSPRGTNQGDNIEIVTAQPFLPTASKSPNTRSTPRYNGTSNHRMEREFKRNVSSTSFKAAKNLTTEDSKSSSSQIVQTVVKRTETINSESKSASMEVNSSESSSSNERNVRRRKNIYSLRGVRNYTVSTTTKPRFTSTTTTSTTTTTTPPTNVPTPESIPLALPKAALVTELITHVETVPQDNTNDTEMYSEMNVKPIFATLKELNISSEQKLESLKPLKEVSMINNEKVEIVRPTPISELVGQYQTPTVTIAALDQAVLGTVSNNIPKLSVAKPTFTAVKASYTIENTPEQERT